MTAQQPDGLTLLEMWIDICLTEFDHVPKGYFNGYSKFVEAAAEYENRGHKSALRNVKHMINHLKQENGIREVLEMFPQLQDKIASVRHD